MLILLILQNSHRIPKEAGRPMPAECLRFIPRIFFFHYNKKRLREAREKAGFSLFDYLGTVFLVCYICGFFTVSFSSGMYCV